MGYSTPEAIVLGFAKTGHIITAAGTDYPFICSVFAPPSTSLCIFVSCCIQALCCTSCCVSLCLCCVLCWVYLFVLCCVSLCIFLSRVVSCVVPHIFLSLRFYRYVSLPRVSLCLCWDSSCISLPRRVYRWDSLCLSSSVCALSCQRSLVFRSYNGSCLFWPPLLGRSRNEHFELLHGV